MSIHWWTEIQQLRERIPVGIKPAQRLLTQTKGDVAAAVTCFHAEQTALLKEKAGVTLQEAERFLLQAGYDFAQSLKLIEQERYTLTELILLKHNKKNEAVDMIALAIEHEWNLTRHYWLSDDDLKNLPPVLRCFMLVCEWRNYDGWEDFSSALFFELTMYCEQLTMLGLHKLAATLMTARKYYDELLSVHGKKAHEIVCQDKRFNALEVLYHQQEDAIDDALVTLAKNNLDVFPCRHQKVP